MEFSDDIVKLATGTLVEMQLLENELLNTGVEARLVGDDLTAGLGTTLPGSVELWVRANDSSRAEEIVQRYLETRPDTTEAAT